MVAGGPFGLFRVRCGGPIGFISHRVGVRKGRSGPTSLSSANECGYGVGVFSSRKLQKRLVEDVAFRVLAAGNRSRKRGGAIRFLIPIGAERL